MTRSLSITFKNLYFVIAPVWIVYNVPSLDKMHGIMCMTVLTMSKEQRPLQQKREFQLTFSL
jgi:hypothetical protein